MSALECDRNNCDNIMCNHISHQHDLYICDECLNELKTKYCYVDIKWFMKTPKEPNMDDGMQKAWEDYIDRVFTEM